MTMIKPNPLAGRFAVYLVVGALAGVIVHAPNDALAQSTAESGTVSDAWSLVIEPGHPAETVRFFDANGDGKVDRTEYSIRIVAFVAKLDKNRDDVLTPDEVPGLSDSAFKSIDGNGDGKLSDYEVVTADTLRFESIDANKDQFITADEIASHVKRSP